MFFGKFGRRMLATSWIAGAIVAVAMPALAQMAGRLQGKVTDEKGAAVQGARVVVTEMPDQGGKWEAVTDKNGNYVIATLPRTGNYAAVASKEGVGGDEQRAGVKIGNPVTLNFKLVSGAGRPTEAQLKQNAAAKKAFEEGLVAVKAENHQGAATAFAAAAAAMPTCAECYFNLGISHQQLKNSADAEAAFKKVIELRPTDPAPYNALVALYTVDRKMDLAAEAATKAAELSVSSAGGGNAETLYSAGVGLWNANKFPEAGSTFESAIKLDPNHAESHFMLGKVYLNLGKLKEAAAEYEMYLKLQPDGKNAAEAKTTFEALKPMLK